MFLFGEDQTKLPTLWNKTKIELLLFYHPSLGMYGMPWISQSSKKKSQSRTGAVRSQLLIQSHPQQLNVVIATLAVEMLIQSQ